MKRNLYIMSISIFVVVAVIYGVYFYQGKKIAEFSFDEISLDETDPGLTFSFVDEAGCFSGRTYDSKWRGNRIIMPVVGDRRTKIEISGDFKVAHGEEHYLVALWGWTKDNKPGLGPLCMYYEENNNEGKVVMQTRWLTLPSKLIKGKRRMNVDLLTKDKDFHTMRILLDRLTSKISYYFDDALLGVIYVEGEIGPITKMMMDIETPLKGIELDVRYDNLKARSFEYPYWLTQIKKKAINFYRYIKGKGHKEKTEKRKQALTEEITRHQAEIKREKEEKKQQIKDLYKQAEVRYNEIKSLKWSYANIAKYDKVIDDCKTVVDSLPGSEIALKAQYLIIKCYEKKNDYKKTFKAEQAEYKERFKLLDKYTDMMANYYDSNKAAEVLKDIADKFLDKQEYKEAQKYYKLIIKKYPESNCIDYAHYKIAESFMRADKYEEAYKKCKTFLKDYPNSKYVPDVLGEMSFFYLRNQQYEKEIAFLRRIIRDYPEYDECDWAQYNIFLAYYYQEKYDEAKKEGRILLKNYPDSSYAEWAQGRMKNLSD